MSLSKLSGPTCSSIMNYMHQVQAWSTIEFSYQLAVLSLNGLIHHEIWVSQGFKYSVQNVTSTHFG